MQNLKNIQTADDDIGRVVHENFKNFETINLNCNNKNKRMDEKDKKERKKRKKLITGINGRFTKVRLNEMRMNMCSEIENTTFER